MAEVKVDDGSKDGTDFRPRATEMSEEKERHSVLSTVIWPTLSSFN
jgi:hypothetical protein